MFIEMKIFRSHKTFVEHEKCVTCGVELKQGQKVFDVMEVAIRSTYDATACSRRCAKDYVSKLQHVADKN